MSEVIKSLPIDPSEWEALEKAWSANDLRVYFAASTKSQIDFLREQKAGSTLISYGHTYVKNGGIPVENTKGMNVLLDSGAFTNRNTPGAVSFEGYCEFLKDEAKKVSEYVTFDVIGDDEATCKNHGVMLGLGLKPLFVDGVLSPITDFKKKVYKGGDKLCWANFVPKSMGRPRRNAGAAASTPSVSKADNMTHGTGAHIIEAIRLRKPLADERPESKVHLLGVGTRLRRFMEFITNVDSIDSTSWIAAPQWFGKAVWTERREDGWPVLKHSHHSNPSKEAKAIASAHGWKINDYWDRTALSLYAFKQFYKIFAKRAAIAYAKGEHLQKDVQKALWEMDVAEIDLFSGPLDFYEPQIYVWGPGADFSLEEKTITAAAGLAGGGLLAPGQLQMPSGLLEDVMSPTTKAELSSEIDATQFDTDSLLAAHDQLHSWFRIGLRQRPQALAEPSGRPAQLSEDPDLVKMHAAVVEALYARKIAHPAPPADGLDNISADFEAHAAQNAIHHEESAQRARSHLQGAGRKQVSQARQKSATVMPEICECCKREPATHDAWWTDQPDAAARLCLSCLDWPVIDGKGVIEISKAEWPTRYVNDLPDSAFLFIEPGGKKDEGGKTVPRSLRHFPVKDIDGKIDLPHLRNALSRIPQSGDWLTPSARDRIIAEAERMLEQVNAEKSVEKRYEAALYVPILKLDEERRLMTGIVLEPDEVDAQNDTIDADVIEKAAFNFLSDFGATGGTRLGLMHRRFGDVGLELVESWIAREDGTLNGQKVKAGSWLMTVRAVDDALWKQVKEGKLTGFSIGGVAVLS